MFIFLPLAPGGRPHDRYSDVTVAVTWHLLISATTRKLCGRNSTEFPMCSTRWTHWNNPVLNSVLTGLSSNSVPGRWIPNRFCWQGDDCPLCGAVEETVVHFITECVVLEWVREQFGGSPGGSIRGNIALQREGGEEHCIVGGEEENGPTSVRTCT